jgi:excisionase family DNA binding protein
VNEQLLTVADVAARCQLHPKTVNRAILRGDLRAQPLGKRGAYRIRPEWVDEWIDTPRPRLATVAPQPRPPRPGPRGTLRVTDDMGPQRAA